MEAGTGVAHRAKEGVLHRFGLARLGHLHHDVALW